MGTRNVTKSGFFVRKRVRRHFVAWLWGLIQGTVIKEHPVAWQPTLPCVCCNTQIEQNAHFCAYCGVSQLAETVLLQQTEAISRLPAARQTEELQIKAETSEMRVVRLAREGAFLQRYRIEQGLYSWLYLQIRTSYRDGEELITASKKQGCNQYPWLHDRIKERGTLNLIAEFKWRCELQHIAPFQSTLTRELPQEMRNGQRAN